jgi:hypothetical protein
MYAAPVSLLVKLRFSLNLPCVIGSLRGRVVLGGAVEMQLERLLRLDRAAQEGERERPRRFRVSNASCAIAGASKWTITLKCAPETTDSGGAFAVA